MRVTAYLTVTLFLIGACGDDDKASDTTSDTGVTDTGTTDTGTADVASDTGVDPDVADTAVAEDTSDVADTAVEDVADTADTTPADPTIDCDPLDPAACSLPFPSNLYLATDAATETGYHLEFGTALPRNLFDTPIDPAPYRRLDGYGVGTPLLAVFPNIDVSALATEDNVPPSLDDNATVVWFEQVGDEEPVRVPYFVDIDAGQPDAAQRVTIIRPARLLREGAHQIVAFRNLVDSDGAPIPRSTAFQALVDGNASDPKLTSRAARFESVFTFLTAHGVDKASLNLAWDFNTASDKSLHGPMLAMRDAAIAEVGDNGAELLDVEVEELTGDDNWAFELRGRFKVPNFTWPTPLYNSDGTAWVFDLDADGKPKRNGFVEPNFWLRVPKSAVDGSHTPHGLVIYGHGQNGSGTQVRGGMNGKIANAHHYVFFACDMWGMSEDDLVGIIDMLFDMSGFPRMADRLQQGVLNHVLLARAMKAQLATRSEITSRGVVIDPSQVFYSGISQGGIYGPTIVAVSPDIQRGHFGVPGNNYAFLLGRSRNFEDFFLILSNAYTARVDQVILLQTIEQLWEQADSVSYIRHLHADPFALPGGGAGTPKEGLWAPAKGDVQVAVASNEWLARSDIGISLMRPWDALTRPEVSGAAMADYPRAGSGIVLYDFGNPWPDPSVNLPPTSDAPDPHSKPRQEAWHSRQLDHFFQTGEIVDVCSDDATAGCAPD